MIFAKDVDEEVGEFFMMNQSKKYRDELTKQKKKKLRKKRKTKRAIKQAVENG